ncbi:MAG: PIG-L family deacetylase, partial [Verrucomicrobia bacterium]|nr:PIG-L family deacetylase [Verrucomicrobiota bacterium]
MEGEAVYRQARAARLVAGFAVFLAAGLCRGERDAPCAPAAPLEWRADDRVLVLAPHPGDEVLGGGGVLRSAIAAGVPVRVVFLTCGDHNQWSLKLYRERLVAMPDAVSREGVVRMEESRKAAQRLGLHARDVIFLGYPDLGTLNIWCAHWAEQMPFRCMLTRTRQVSCADARHPGAPYKGEFILEDLKEIFREFRPTRILVSHPADHHPDHQALYLFSRVALWTLSSDPAPELWPYLIHHPQWPPRTGPGRRRDLAPPPTLASPISWRSIAVGKKARRLKQKALEIHRTDYQRNAAYLDRFVRDNELFGDFPDLVLDKAMVALDPPTSGTSRREPPEELNPAEKERFVGIESRTIGLEEQELRMEVRLTRPLEREASASICVLGFRPDKPFEQMPKVHVYLTAFSHEVFDQSR